MLLCYAEPEFWYHWVKGGEQERIKSKKKKNACCITNDDKFLAKRKGGEVGVDLHPSNFGLFLY